VWFESGVSYKAVAEKAGISGYPTDLYLEGSDQHRGWFQSSLMTSSALTPSAPYKTVLTHGFVVDAEGKKMSKSMGNVVDPLDIIERYGADILRLWVASSDYTIDLKLSESHFTQITESYRKVRNSFRFLLGNLCDFNAGNSISNLNELKDLDKWILIKLNEVIAQMEKDLDEYRFYRAWSKAYNFCNNELSAVYFNIQKDILYCAHKKSKERLSAQTAMKTILDSLIRVLFPFIPYTCEEVWQDIHKDITKSVAMEYWPKISIIDSSDKIINNFNLLFDLRDEVLKQIETMIASKEIRSALQTEVLIFSEEFDIIPMNIEELKRFFIVSGVKFSKETKDKEKKISIKVVQKNGIKCSRCWVIFDEKETTSDYPDLCAYCTKVMNTK